MKAIAVLLAVLALTACGRRETLRPAAGEALPVTPAEARVQPTVDDLLTPTPTARPARNEEVLKRSEERTEDRFDLPPPG